MKRTAQIALAIALLMAGGATLAMAQSPLNPNYRYYAWPSYEPFYNLAPNYFPGDYPAPQPTDTGTVVAGAAAGATGAIGAGANRRRTADAISQAASRYSQRSAALCRADWK